MAVEDLQLDGPLFKHPSVIQEGSLSRCENSPGAGYVRVRKEIGADEEEHGGVKKNKGKKETRRM